MRRGVFLFGVSLLVSGCNPPPPTRVAVTRELPPIDEGKALVVFMFPPCARYAGPVATMEEALLCRTGRRNRIRVVERGARLVTDFGVDQYGASYEEPGRHLYAAYHHSDHCTFGRTDCVAAMNANLLPGKVYLVTFRWYYDTTGYRGLQYGRLEMTPVSAPREAIFRAHLAHLERVEPVPGFRELGLIGELRSSYVSNHVLDRVAQDRADGVKTPMLGGRSWVEELDEEELKKLQKKEKEEKADEKTEEEKK